MKTLNLFRVLMLVVMASALSFTSCKDESEEDSTILSQLIGRWMVREPVVEDGYLPANISYMFMRTKLMNSTPGMRYPTELLCVVLMQ